MYTELEEAVFQLLNRNGLLASSVRLPVLLHNLAHLTHACLCGHCETNLDEERRVERLVHRLDQGHTLERVALVRIESARPLARSSRHGGDHSHRRRRSGETCEAQLSVATVRQEDKAGGKYAARSACNAPQSGSEAGRW